MKCMCPRCGEMIPKGKLSFNMNTFVLKKVLEVIGDENSTIQDGCKMYFNHWENKKKPFQMTEEELWNYPVANGSGTLEKQKRIMFSILPEKLLQMVKKYGRPKDGDDEVKVMFEEWLKSSAYEIQKRDLF